MRPTAGLIPLRGADFRAIRLRYGLAAHVLRFERSDAYAHPATYFAQNCAQQRFTDV